MDGGAPVSRDPVLSVVGERVALGPLHRGLLPLLWRWENDVGLAALTGDPARPLTPEAIEADYERYAKAERPDAARFAIYERATLRPIGTAGLIRIDHLHRTAEFGIGIGEADCWGKGYGTEATRLVLDYAFTALGLHNVALRVFAFNERAIRAYRRAGFKEIGRRREAHRLGERAFDELLMDCLATEFPGAVLRDLLP
jgi:RimJ/RimL family protein N-acetyltransferase